MQAERNRIRAAAMNGSFLSDPMEHLKHQGQGGPPPGPAGGRRDSYNQAVNGKGYTPSMYEDANQKRLAGISF